MESDGRWNGTAIGKVGKGRLIIREIERKDNHDRTGQRLDGALYLSGSTPPAEKPARVNSLGAAGADRGYVGAVQRYDGGVKGTG